MSDIQSDLSAILADFAQKSVGGGDNSTSPSPTETPAATGESVEQATTTEALEAKPEASTASEVKSTENPTGTSEPEESDVFSDWDTKPEPATEAPTAGSSLPVEVLTDLGKALGLDKVQSKDDLVAAISTLKGEAEKAKVFDQTQIHPELLKAIELNRKGGDFYEYLKVTSVDYNAVDPVELYEEYVIDQLKDANGNVDEDQVNDYLDSMKDADKRLRGIELQKKLMFDQQRKIADIERDAILKKEKHDAELKSALSGLSEIDGFKVDDSHRREVFNWVTSKMMRDLFYGPDGNLDPAKIAKVGFRNLYYEKLDAYQKNKIRNSTKREILAEVTNAQITSPSISTNPTTKKGYDINDYITSLEQKLVNK